MQLFKYIICLLALCSSVNSHAAGCTSALTSFDPPLPAAIPNSAEVGATVWSGQIRSTYSGCGSPSPRTGQYLIQEIFYSSTNGNIKNSAGNPMGLQLTFSNVPPSIVPGSENPVRSNEGTTNLYTQSGNVNTVAKTTIIKNFPISAAWGITTTVAASIRRTGSTVNGGSLTGSFIDSIPFPWISHNVDIGGGGPTPTAPKNNTFSGTVPDVSANTCRVDTASQNMTVKLPTVAISSFPNTLSVGGDTTGMPGRTPFVISLTGCSATSSGFTANATWFFGLKIEPAMKNTVGPITRAMIRIKDDVGTTQLSGVTTTIISIPPGGGTVNKTFYADYYFIGQRSSMTTGTFIGSATFTISYN